MELSMAPALVSDKAKAGEPAMAQLQRATEAP